MISGRGFPHENGVKILGRCELKVGDGAWSFAETFAREIDAHWQKATAANASYFNGVVYLIGDLRIDESELSATLIRTNFKSYLYWRSLGYPETGVLDGFGSALIRSSDGQFLLVMQRPGNVNYGYAYLPSGFIDEKDVLANGTVDISRSVEREVEEEIGEAGRRLQREDGFFVARSNAQLCFAVPFYLPMTAEAFAAELEQHNATTDDPELEAVVPVARLEQLDGLKTLPYARLLLEALLVAR
ncbi:MAG: NUDIX domain-containing protein [Hyphomicrobium sp.]